METKKIHLKLEIKFKSKSLNVWLKTFDKILFSLFTSKKPSDLLCHTWCLSCTRQISFEYCETVNGNIEREYIMDLREHHDVTCYKTCALNSLLSIMQ